MSRSSCAESVELGQSLRALVQQSMAILQGHLNGSDAKLHFRAIAELSKLMGVCARQGIHLELGPPAPVTLPPAAPAPSLPASPSPCPAGPAISVAPPPVLSAPVVGQKTPTSSLALPVEPLTLDLPNLLPPRQGRKSVGRSQSGPDVRRLSSFLGSAPAVQPVKKPPDS